MSDYDRGAYTPPTDDPLAFDARMPRQRRPMPMTLIASAVVLLVMVGAVFAFYTSGVRGANEPPKVVGDSLPAVKGPPVQEARPLSSSRRSTKSTGFGLRWIFHSTQSAITTPNASMTPPKPTEKSGRQFTAPPSEPSLRRQDRLC